MKTESKTPGAGANGQGPGAMPASVTADTALKIVSLEFQNFLADIEDLIKATTSLTGEDLAKAKAKLSERIAAAKDSVEEAGGTIVEQARAGAAVTNAYVHEQPWKAIGIGTALGFLLGFALARRA